MTRLTKIDWLMALASVSLAAAPPCMAQRIDWPQASGDQGAMRWSPATDISRENVKRLTQAWTWKTGERAFPDGPGQKAVRPGQFQASPVVINDTMYVSTPYAGVAALDATNGREIWRFESGAWKAGQPSNGTGLVHRGVGVWSGVGARRVFINARWRLIALDARTGLPIPSFGTNGEVNLLKTLRREVKPQHYTNTSPVAIVGDVVIVGNG
ncbi:MAG: hypothetical protein ABIT38_00045, partial [Gemmatimonadaceae bacterium]